MIKGDAKLTITHQTVVVALQEYFQRHFAAGSCPTIHGIAEIRPGGSKLARDVRNFEVALGDAVSTPPLEYGVSAGSNRQYDLEA